MRFSRNKNGFDSNSKLMTHDFVSATDVIPIKLASSSSLIYDNDFTSIINIYFYETFSTLNLIQ